MRQVHSVQLLIHDFIQHDDIIYDDIYFYFPSINLEDTDSRYIHEHHLYFIFHLDSHICVFGHRFCGESSIS